MLIIRRSLARRDEKVAQGSNGLESNYRDAFKWLSLAAEQGQPDAQVTLGQMYENGEGTPQDYGLAAHWYRKAADHTVDFGGAGQGANHLAQLYKQGHATAQDYVFVYLWNAYAGNAEGLHDVAKRMNPTQVVDAQRRVREWAKSHVPCLPTGATTPPMASSATYAR